MFNIKKIRFLKNRLRLTLTTLGFIWGVVSYFFRLSQANGGPTPDEAIVELPLTIAAFVFGWASDLYVRLGTPVYLALFLVLFFLLSAAFVGAAIGFVSAAIIEKLALFFHRTKASS